MPSGPPRVRLPLLGFACLALLGACQPQPAPPQAAARDFVRRLVETPEGAGPLAEALEENLGARIRLDYLRTQRRQGMRLYYRVPAAGGDGPRREVPVRVSTREEGPPGPGDVVFAVTVARTGAGPWRAVAVRLLRENEEE